MTDMVERVAKALNDEWERVTEAPAWDGMCEGLKEMWCSAARVATAAMREAWAEAAEEITPEMTRAGAAELAFCSPDVISREDSVDVIYLAMVRAKARAR